MINRKTISSTDKSPTCSQFGCKTKYQFRSSPKTERKTLQVTPNIAPGTSTRNEELRDCPGVHPPWVLQNSTKGRTFTSLPETVLLRAAHCSFVGYPGLPGTFRQGLCQWVIEQTNNDIRRADIREGAHLLQSSLYS